MFILRKNRLFVFLFALALNVGLAQNSDGKLIVISNGDTIMDYSQISINVQFGERIKRISDFDGNIHGVDSLEMILKIVVVYFKDTLAYFDNTNVLNLPPPLNQLNQRNYSCFFKKNHIWQLYFDSYPFELESIRLTNEKDKKKKFLSLWIKGCVEELNNLP